jgi:SAM-dependent methyltransferase
MDKKTLSDDAWGKKIQDVGFWKKRYETHREGDENFEWYCGYAQIKELFEATVGDPTIDKTILDLGCGSSTLSVEMRNAGYRVIGLDYVKDQIDFLNHKFKDVEHLHFVHGDFRFMTRVFSTLFEVVMDKGGFDSILASGSVDTAEKTASQIDLLLKAFGHFICISHADPETDLGQQLLSVVLSNVDHRSNRWSVDIHSASETMDEDGTGGFHVYIFHKVPRPRTRSVTQALHSAKSSNGINFSIRRHYH